MLTSTVIGLALKGVAVTAAEVRYYPVTMMKWRHDDGFDDVWRIPAEVEELILLGIRALRKYLAETPPAPSTIHLTIKGNEMENYQLNAGDSVVVTVTDTDNVTGLPVTPDAGSVSVVLSSLTDSVVANADGTYTVTAGTTTGTGNTVTVNATVNGVASLAAVGTYDVVAAAPDATTLSVSFGTESAPAVVAPPVVLPAGTVVDDAGVTFST